MFISRKEKKRLFSVLERIEPRIVTIFNNDNVIEIAILLFSARADIHLDVFINDPDAIVVEDPKGLSVYGNICQYYHDRISEVEELLFDPSFLIHKGELYRAYRKAIMKRHTLYVKTHMEINNERERTKQISGKSDIWT